MCAPAHCRLLTPWCQGHISTPCLTKTWEISQQLPREDWEASLGKALIYYFTATAFILYWWRPWSCVQREAFLISSRSDSKKDSPNKAATYCHLVFLWDWRKQIFFVFLNHISLNFVFIFDQKRSFMSSRFPLSRDVWASTLKEFPFRPHIVYEWQNMMLTSVPTITVWTVDHREPCNGGKCTYTYIYVVLATCEAQ